MAKTVIGLFQNFSDVHKIISDLQDGGIPREDISLFASDSEGRFAPYFDAQGNQVDGRMVEDARSGAGTGAMLDGVAGLLGGLGALALPSIGSVVAAGPLLSDVTGAGNGDASSGLAGALINSGVSQQEAERYAAGVRHGGALITVRASDDMALRASEILERHNPVGSRGQEVMESERIGANHSRSSVPYDINSESTSLEDQVVRLGVHRSTLSGDATRDFWPDYTGSRPSAPPGEDIHTDLDDEPIGAGGGLFTHLGIVDRSELPEDTLPLTQPMGDEIEVIGPDGRDTDFRDHYDAHYATSDLEFVQYLPAYQYGYELGLDEEYRDQDWSIAEPLARRQWEQLHPDSPWEQFCDAIHFGWDAARAD